jgi:hypothetical protein
MAKALSHLFSDINGSLGGLTYQASGQSSIIMRSRTRPDQVKSNAAFLNIAYTRGGQLIWDSCSPSQREQIVHWSEMNDYPFLGKRPRSSDSARLGYITLYRLARRAGLLQGYAPIANSLPSLNCAGYGVRLVAFTSLVAGKLRFWYGQINTFPLRYYYQVIGPYPRTTMRRPCGWNAKQTLSGSSGGGASVTIDFSPLQSGAVYFGRIQLCCAIGSEIAYVGEFETRAVIL